MPGPAPHDEGLPVPVEFAAGWHVCTDSLLAELAGTPRGFAVGDRALDHGWVELEAGYRQTLPR